MFSIFRSRLKNIQESLTHEMDKEGELKGEKGDPKKVGQ